MAWPNNTKLKLAKLKHKKVGIFKLGSCRAAARAGVGELIMNYSLLNN
jgi:hypothetical protein